MICANSSTESVAPLPSSFCGFSPLHLGLGLLCLLNRMVSFSRRISVCVLCLKHGLWTAKSQLQPRDLYHANHGCSMQECLADDM